MKQRSTVAGLMGIGFALAVLGLVLEAVAFLVSGDTPSGVGVLGVPVGVLAIAVAAVGLGLALVGYLRLGKA